MRVRLGSARIAAAGPVVVATFLSVLGAGTAAAEVWRVNNVDNAVAIHLRQQASNRSKVLAYIPGDARGLQGGACEGNWCPVEYKDLKGWVFSKYLEPDEGTVEVAAPAGTMPETAVNPAPKGLEDELEGPKILKVVKTDGPPVPVYSFPNEKMPVAGHLPPETDSVEGVAPCRRNWCYIRSGSLVGWLPQSAFVKSDAPVTAKSDAPANVKAETLAVKTTAAIVEKPADTQEGRALNNTVNTATQAASINPAVPEAVEDSDRKTYVLAGLGGDAYLSMRERAEEGAPVVASIPGDAKTVEGMQKCARQWCLVRYRGQTGWVLRRHLADESLETSQTFQVNGVAMWSALDVVDYPGQDAKVVGRIPSYATGIVPIGGCDKTWCHVRYLGIAGWVSGQYLAPLAR